MNIANILNALNTVFVSSDVIAVMRQKLNFEGDRVEMNGIMFIESPFLEKGKICSTDPKIVAQMKKLIK